jgi:hypothetical protein
MDYYNIGLGFELNRDKNKAIYFFELSKLFENKLALKHLEYLDEKNKLEYINKFNDYKIHIELLEILVFWYDNLKYYVNTKNFYVSINNNKLEELWDNIWFSKGNKQKLIDVKMKQFSEYYEKFKDFKPNSLYEYIALIILYDQIPRNIFRNSSKAYETDSIAFKYAEYLGKFIDDLPIHICIPIIMSHVHCESLEILNITRDYIKKIKNKLSENINSSLNGILTNHYDRISLFGRIPERNKYLNRISTEKELVYLKSV